MRHFYQSPSPSDIVFYFAILGRTFRDKLGLAGMSGFPLRVEWTAGDMEKEDMHEQGMGVGRRPFSREDSPVDRALSESVAKRLAHTWQRELIEFAPVSA